MVNRTSNWTEPTRGEGWPNARGGAFSPRTEGRPTTIFYMLALSFFIGSVGFSWREIFRWDVPFSTLGLIVVCLFLLVIADRVGYTSNEVGDINGIITALLKEAEAEDISVERVILLRKLLKLDTIDEAD